MDLHLFSFGPTGWGDELVAGLDLTLRLSLTAILAGSAVGLISALGEISRIRILGRLLEALNLVLRSVPELLVIFLIYYGAAIALEAMLSPLGFSGVIDLNRFWSGVLALGLIHAAYASEVFRGAFLAVPQGQIDAARAFGMGSVLVFARIRFPLAMRFALPGLANLAMTTLKSTPLVSAIGLQDLIRVAGDAGQNTKHYFQFYMASLAIYLGIAAIVLIVQNRSEGRLFVTCVPERDEMLMDAATLWDYLPVLLAGAAMTLQLTAFTLIGGFLIALPVALARNSVDRAPRVFAHAFAFFFRGAPLLVVLYLVYYGLPQVPGIKESPIWWLIARPMPIAIVALSLNSAGFLCEILAGALRNVPAGEVEAARAFGFSRFQTFRRIVAPNAARLALRPYGNEAVFVLKGTAVVNFITITDLVGAANQVYFNTFDPFTPLLAAGGFYLVFVFGILGFVKWAEPRLNPWLIANSR